MKELFCKYQEVLAYLSFGGTTTVVNLVVLFVCQNMLELDYKIGNAISRFSPALFAFFTSKCWIFVSGHESIAGLFKRMGLFYWYRILSSVADTDLMVLLIDDIHLPPFWTEMITQIVMVALNYPLSKFFIFREKEV